MKIYSLHTKQKLNIDLKTAWEFFSTPKNLQDITPDDLQFQILSDLPEKMYSGLIIEYYVTPMLGIKLNWVTEISHIEEPNYFVDEQRFGPYKFWHHKHIFTEVDGGVLMEDIVHWGLPFGFIGRLFGAWFVKKQLKHIFTFREKMLNDKFNK